mgnify:CR=1 FL=1
MALLGNNNIIQQQHFKSNYAFYGSPGFSNSPGVSTGPQAFTFHFTPKSSSSEIYIESSIHVIYEDSNIGDQAFVLAHYDSTIMALNYAPAAYFVWNGYYNCAFIALQGYVNSWGTSQKTIKIRFGRMDLLYIIIEQSSMQISTVVLTEITTYIIL